jgi:hypothetical protein
LPYEKSLDKVFAALREEGLTKKDVANQLAIHSDEINELTFGLMLNALKGGAPRTAEAAVGRAKLKLVKG